jgi:hypothetical protein
VLLFYLISAAAAVVSNWAPRFEKVPQHTSSLTGLAWLRELFQGHPIRFYNVFGMERHVFRQLVVELALFTGLGHSKHVRMVEQVAIFLWMVRMGARNREAMERFQRSADTISK